MPVQLRDLRALEGPNMYYGQAAVKLQLWADRDLRRQISDLVKQWSQQVGVVIGALRQTAEPELDGLLITTTWTTPLPNVGELIAEGVLADLQDMEQPDDEYSHDDRLFAAIDARKREEPSLAVLQLYAEARVRELPFLPRGDGKIMLGTGARGWQFDTSELSLGLHVNPPWDAIGTIPVVAVTGTNGKTTTTRLIAHIVSALGKRVGRTDTDGIVIAGERVEEGDWAGFGGARRVLTDRSVDVAVLETSRGGILRRGLGFPWCDVSVVTNISADHLGEHGIYTLDQMAEVKGVVVLATRPDGLVVLNADDPRVLQMREWSSAPVCLWSRERSNPAITAYAAAGGATITTDAQHIFVQFDVERGTVPLHEIPITFGGAAAHNVDNVMAAIGACLGLGIHLPLIRAALATFLPDSAHNINRLNVWQRNGITIAFDYAHNVAGLQALLRFGQGMREQAGGAGRLFVALGGPGDRLDDQIREQGELAGRVADRLLLHEEEQYLRGRALGEMTALYRAGAEAAGAGVKMTIYPDVLAVLDTLLHEITAGDVAVIAAHAHRDVIIERLNAWQNPA